MYACMCVCVYADCACAFVHVCVLACVLASLSAPQLIAEGGLGLGLGLGAEVIRASTSTPATAIGWGDRIGTLGLGRTADVTVLRAEDLEKPLPLEDGVFWQ